MDPTGIIVIANKERQEQRRWIPVGLTPDHGLQSLEMSAVEDHCLPEPDNQTQKSWRPDRAIIRLKAKRGHLGIEKEREETVSVQLQNKRAQESREKV